MKTVLLIIGLKLAELLGVIALGYGFYLLGSILWFTRSDQPWWIIMLAGIVIIYVPLAVIALLFVGSNEVYKLNLKWARHILKKKGKYKN